MPSSGGASKNHKYLWHPDTNTFGNLIAETYVGVKIYFVNNSSALVGLT
jgi:hypothetical protein